MLVAGRIGKPRFLDSGGNMGVAERVNFTERVLLALRENSSVSSGKTIDTTQGLRGKITRQEH